MFKRKSVQILITILVCLFIMAGCGGFVYLQIEQTNAFSSTLQQNIIYLNRNSIQNQSITQEVTDKVQEPYSSETVEVTKQDLTNLLRRVNDFIDQTNRLKNSLEAINNPDILEFNSQSEKLLDLRADHLEILTKVINLTSCYLDKTDLLYGWVPQINQQWSDLNSQNQPEEVAELASTSKQRIDESIPVLTELKDCFQADFPEFLNTDIEVTLEEESQEYTNFSQLFTKLNSSLDTLNASDYQSSITEISQITFTQSTFGRKINQTFNETIRQSLTVTNQKVQDQEIILNRIITNLKEDYQLNTSL